MCVVTVIARYTGGIGVEVAEIVLLGERQVLQPGGETRVYNPGRPSKYRVSRGEVSDEVVQDILWQISIGKVVGRSYEFDWHC